MRFTPSFLDEIKARLPVSEVVRRRVKLVKAGREWKGLSPFNAEKSPSFFVNDHKMAWFDFSSGNNGNIFDFVMRTEGLSFPEAVERLAGEAGLQLPVVSRESEQRDRERATLQEVMELAAAFFEAQLQAKEGARARGYLADRGMAPATQRQFRIGYSPAERFALRDHLAGKGVLAEQMIEAGLLVHGEDIAVPYDRFRDRVMFPICDRSGRVIAFGGRAMDKEVSAKYLNSPETPLFHKSHVLYNHHNARKAAHDKGVVIAVEGYVDVISMAAVGFAHVVAPMGTALTPEQCELLWRMAEEPVLCFDGDKAGRKAAYRAIETALPLIGAGKSLRFAFLPDGQDPDDLARSGGAEAIEAVLGASRPLVDVLWTRETEAGQLDTPERRAALERRLFETIKAITDETLRRHYRQEIEARLGALFGRAPGMGGGRTYGRPGGQQGQGRGFRPSGGRYGAPPPPRGYLDQAVPASPSLARSPLFAAGRAMISQREALIALIAVNLPRLTASYAEDLAGVDFASRELARLVDLVLGRLSDPYLDAPAVRAAIGAAGLGELLGRVERATDQSLAWCVRPDAEERDAEEVLKQALALHRRARALHKELRSAELALGLDPTDENLNRLREIQAELSGIEGREAMIEGFGLSVGRQSTGL
jgi:DNA primase